MSRCDMFLDNYATCYYAGQQIVGRLRCFFDSPKSTSGIFVKIKGIALVEWTESERRQGADNKSHTVLITYRGIHELIKERISLVYQHGNKINIPAGEHVFPFSFTLPPDLPSTFNTSSIGKVKYIIKGYVDMAFQFDYKAETEINVVEVFDLNRDSSNLTIPVNVNKQKTLGCLCWRSGPIHMSLSIPYTGFVPGQSVPITLRIENLSRTSIPTVRFDIHQIIMFHATSPRSKNRTDTNMITGTEELGVGAHGDRIYELHLQIPASFTPLNLKKCAVIDVKYALNVEVVVPGLHTNMKQTVFIEVGNIALVDSGYRAQQYAQVPLLAEPESTVVGDVDGFAIVGPDTNPSAPPAIYSAPPAIHSVPVGPTAPPPSSADIFEQPQAGIGWINPSADTTEPPAYDDLFEKKQ